MKIIWRRVVGGRYAFSDGRDELLVFVDGLREAVIATEVGETKLNWYPGGIDRNGEPHATYVCADEPSARAKLRELIDADLADDVQEVEQTVERVGRDLRAVTSAPPGAAP